MDQKTKVSEATETLILSWVENKLTKSSLKVSYFKQLEKEAGAKLLQAALASELKQDFTALLKGLSLLYDRQQIDRIIQSYQIGNQPKISNAIEMLELILPKKYFMQVNNLFEFLQDIQTNVFVFLPTKAGPSAASIVQDILVQNSAGCNAWTKSVALYVVPKLRNQNISAAILNQKPEPGDVLFQETQQYVLSVLN